MTDAPQGAAPQGAAPARARPPRRSPTALDLAFADRAVADELGRSMGDPDWLAADRAEALEAYRRLPIESNPLYTTYVDLRNAELSDVSLAPPAAANASSRTALAPELPDGVAAIIVLGVGGSLGATLGDEARAAGLILESSADFARRDPAGFRAAVLAAGALPADDKIAQLTRAFWGIGVHVDLPRGARLRAPIVIRWTFGGATALLSRTFIDLAEDTEAHIVEEIRPADDGEPGVGLLTGTTEVRLGPGSTLQFASLQELSETQVAFQHRTASIGRDARLHWALAQLGSRLVRSRVDNRLEGDGSSVEQVEIVFGSADQLFDLTSYTRHIGKNATSNLLSKAALQDASRSFLKGLVTIDKSGSGTDSFLGEYGMNLSKKARAVAIPSLEIDQPDCRRVAHSSSVGPIDETQLFYLESRGIPPDEARKFIVLGFLEPVVARVPLEAARDRLRGLLEEKWDAAHGSAETAA